MFPFGSSNLIGVDLGSHTVKVMKLKRSGDTYKVEGAAVARVDDEVAATLRVSDALRRALAASRVKPGKAATALGAPELSSLQVTLPKMPPSDLADAVKWDIRKSLHIPADELVSDYVVSSTGSPDEAGKLSIIAFGANKRYVNTLFTACKQASVELRVVDALPTALLAAFDINGEWEEGVSYAILDIGLTTSTLVVLGDRGIRFVRVLPFGGANMTHALAHALGTGHAEAERAKIDASLTGTSLVPSPAVAGKTASRKGDPKSATRVVGILKESLDVLVGDVSISFDYFHAKFRDDSIRKLYLTGGTAAVTGIDELFSNSIGVPAFVLNPLGKLKMSGSQDKGRLYAIASSLTVATGLATRRRGG